MEPKDKYTFNGREIKIRLRLTQGDSNPWIKNNETYVLALPSSFARFTGMSLGVIGRLMDDGDLPSMTIGGRRYVISPEPAHSRRERPVIDFSQQRDRVAVDVDHEH